MKIGVPKEIKNNESRVGMTPAGVLELVREGHEVSIQSGAGDGSGFFDDDYLKAGARIVSSIEEVYAANEMIVKVKEPLPEEYAMIRKDQLVFTGQKLPQPTQLPLAI